MNCPEHYFDDLLLFFEGWPLELGLYQGLYELLDSARLPGVSVHVQKSQLSFYGRHLFAAASLPLRRKKRSPPAMVTACPMRVARAAPSTPRCRTHTKA